MDKKTALFNNHLDLNAKMAPFGGWLMPIQYEGILAEHKHTREMCSLFDICHMGEFLISGELAAADLERLLSCRISNLDNGQCRYGFLLNEEGGVLDDLTCYRLGPQDFFLVVNAGTAESDAAWVQQHLSPGTIFEDVSAVTAKLDVQGPRSREVLERVAGGTLPELGYFRSIYLPIFDSNVLLSRTGYTGEWGYELYFPVQDAQRIWDLLLTDPAIKPAGLGARDTLRLEMGYPLYGHELKDLASPLAVCGGKFVAMDTDFIGHSALKMEQDEGVAKKLIGLKLESRRAAREGSVVLCDGEEVGVVTSGSVSPSLGVAVAMAMVDASADGVWTLSVRGKELPATKAALPFYTDGSARG